MSDALAYSNKRPQFKLLEKKINLLPEEYVIKLSEYVDFLAYDAEKKARLNHFEAECKKAQAWAKNVELTEQDINDAIRNVRNKNKEKGSTSWSVL